MKDIKSRIMIIFGTMLLIAALFLVLYNVKEDRDGSKASQEILQRLKVEMVTSEPIPTEPDMPAVNDLFEEYEVETVPEEVQIEIDGNYYIGTISIPSLEIELPVMSEWSYPNLKLSPCRYKGTVAGGDIIIAAHNYWSHFGRLNQLYSGDTIIFTDGNGIAHEYQLLQTEVIEGYNIEAMDFGSADNWDLTLFTCTLGGQSRVTVRAVKVK